MLQNGDEELVGINLPVIIR